MKKDNEFLILLLIIFLGGFIADVFYFPIIFDWGSDFRLFFLVLLWIFIVKLSCFSSKATFKLALGFLLLLFTLFMFFHDYPPIERIASWIYFFLLIGIIQQFFEVGKKYSSNG